MSCVELFLFILKEHFKESNLIRRWDQSSQTGNSHIKYCMGCASSMRDLEWFTLTPMTLLYQYKLIYCYWVTHPTTLQLSQNFFLTPRKCSCTNPSQFPRNLDGVAVLRRTRIFLCPEDSQTAEVSMCFVGKLDTSRSLAWRWQHQGETAPITL